MKITDKKISDLIPYEKNPRRNEKAVAKGLKSMNKQELEETFMLGISDEAKEIFKHIASKYKDTIDIEMDFASLAIYAESCAKLAKYNKLSANKSMFVKSKNGETYVHPLHKLIQDEKASISNFGGKLGLNPEARKRQQLELEREDKSKDPRNKY